VGVKAIETHNSMVVKGLGPQGQINQNIEINSNLDHRIAMSFLCLGLISKKPIKVNDTDTIKSSFPFFLDKMKKIGAKFEQL
jgi:3-phosphoshikimate 1-carboxyvinyltransferase